jgi:tetratricopeptide (TPR) repeat protein
MAAHVELSRLQQDSLTGLMRPFGAYKVLAGFDQRTGQSVFADREEVEDRAGDKNLHPGVHINKRVTAGEQMRARQLQMEGDFAQAVQIYTNVRSKSKDVLKARPSAPDQIMHAKAIDDAMFWTGLCQFEQGEFKSAVNTFQRYRKQPDAEKWQRESRYLLALSLAAEGDTAAAIAQLEPVPPDDPEYLGDRWLIRQWQGK